MQKLQYHSAPRERADSILKHGLRLPRNYNDVTTFQHSDIATVSTADEPQYATVYNPSGVLFTLAVDPSTKWLRRSTKNTQKGELLIDAVDRWLREAYAGGYDAVYVDQGLQSTVGNQFLDPSKLKVIDHIVLGDEKIQYRGAIYAVTKNAAVLQIDQDFVQRWRLGLLRFLRSADVVVNYDTALEFKEVAKQYNHELEDTILERFVKNVLPYELGLPNDIVKYWTKRLRKSAWDLHIDLLSVPLERADDYYTKEARYHRFVSELDAWVARVQRHARALWKDLKEFVDQYPQYNATATQPYVETLDQQNLSIEGFDVRIVGAGQGFHKKDTAHFLDVARQALKRYRATAKDKFPWLLRHTLPFVLHFDVTLDKGGEYDPHYITLYMSNLTSSREDMDPVSRLTHTIAHEMGHFVYKQYLGRSAREFWEQAVRQDYGPNLDLQYVLDKWPERYDRLLMVDDVFLAKGDVDTYLQLNSLYYHPHYRYQIQNATKQDVINMMTEDRYLSVPKHPISGYASKSYEEAFCEAFGVWLAWGDRAVYPIVRSWLSVVLPEVSIRTASFGLVGSQARKKTAGVVRRARQLPIHDYVPLYRWSAVPLHPVRDPILVAELVESMMTYGWRGGPMLIDPVTKELWNGSHRHAAIRRLQDDALVDEFDVPVVYVDVDADDWDVCGCADVNDDQDRLDCLECIGDEDAAAVMLAEMEHR